MNVNLARFRLKSLHIWAKDDCCRLRVPHINNTTTEELMSRSKVTLFRPLITATLLLDKRAAVVVTAVISN